MGFIFFNTLIFTLFVLPRNVTLQMHSPIKYNFIPLTSYVTLFHLNNFSLAICFRVKCLLPMPNCILTFVVSIFTLTYILFAVLTFILMKIMFYSFILNLRHLNITVPFNIPAFSQWKYFAFFLNGQSFLKGITTYTIHDFIYWCSLYLFVKQFIHFHFLLHWFYQETLNVLDFLQCRIVHSI